MTRLAKISGMYERELDATLSDMMTREGDTQQMVEAAARFVEWPAGFLTLWGGYGNGKTLVLQAIVNEAREKHGLLTAYVRFKDLIDYIAGGFDDVEQEGTERQRYDFLKRVDLLSIDEVDKARMTEYRQEFRTSFLDDRYRGAWCEETHTVFAMNCDPAELPPDIYDRLRQFEIVRNNDPSMRPVMKRNTVPF